MLDKRNIILNKGEQVHDKKENNIYTGNHYISC